MLIKLLFLLMNSFALYIAICALKGLYVPNKEFSDDLASCMTFVLFSGFILIGGLFLYSVIQLFR